MAVELYFSTDVETDGPIPGPHSMLSFASACYTADKQLLGTYSANLEPLPGAAPDPKTLAWWQSQGAAWDALQRDRRPPAAVMPEYATWMKTLCAAHKAKPVFVAYPVLFDAMFVYWYLITFAGDKIEGVDKNEVAAKIQAAQTQLEAVFSVVGTTGRLSLVNFLT